MRWLVAALLVPFSLAASPAAHAGNFAFTDMRGVTGNDSGGVIQWIPEIAHIYRDIAAEHCARWNRIAKITSVHPRYGDFVGFRCLYDRSYDPRKAWFFGY
jgi:hypothetical protein